MIRQNETTTFINQKPTKTLVSQRLKGERGNVSVQIEFFEPMRIPSATHQEKQVAVQNGKPHFYEPANVKDARQSYMAHLGRHAPKQPMDGPLCLCVAFEYHKDGIVGDNREWKTTKPDTDNMIKMVKDCMTKLGYWHDDAQVCLEDVQKFYHRYSEMIYVKVVSL